MLIAALGRELVWKSDAHRHEQHDDENLAFHTLYFNSFMDMEKRGSEWLPAHGRSIGATWAQGPT